MTTKVSPTAPIRVLVVDDSAVFRMVLVRVLDRAPGIEVVGVAVDGLSALEAAGRLDPDVITLDVEMPGIDGLATLGRLLARRPTRVIMLSRATRAGAAVTIEALRVGAVDAIAKPEAAWGSGPSPFVDDLLAKIHAAALVPLGRIAPASAPRDRSTLERAAGASAGRPSVPDRRAAPLHRLVVVATSTGGPRALESLLSELPRPLDAGLIVVQHMLTGFTATLAERLDRLAQIDVREAADGDRLIDGVALVAPGDRHLLVDRSGLVALSGSVAVNGVRPAADVTLIAAAPVWGPALLAVVLTGMGRDATEGARQVRAWGGSVIAQDEPSCAVYGMPRSVAEAGLANVVVPLDRIAESVAAWAGTPLAPGATDIRTAAPAERADPGRYLERTHRSTTR
jgi:two-component system chemotaxis response regulator CheB